MQDPQSMRHSSITILSGFCLSFLYAMVFVLAYMLTADWVAAWTPGPTGDILAVWGPPFLISFLAAIPCCCLIVPLQNKLIVPVGFLFLALYYLIFLVVLYRDYSGIELAYLTQMVHLYMLPPAAVGNLLGWGSYLILRRRNK
ncbi:MAG: hypothetical protein ACOX0K_05555 [Oscillospiraceae bacterium]|jgi:hypothetical protein